MRRIAMKSNWEIEDRQIPSVGKPETYYYTFKNMEINHYEGVDVVVSDREMLNDACVSGFLTALRYRVEVLESSVRLFRTTVGPQLISRDDNARS
ncbi:hypothetical protein TNCV_23651 [Trichonephila clavipes]|nr:hypothetical protein TNCV_23651 [Trichonephila clavipes]